MNTRARRYINWKAHGSTQTSEFLNLLLNADKPESGTTLRGSDVLAFAFSSVDLDSYSIEYQTVSIAVGNLDRILILCTNLQTLSVWEVDEPNQAACFAAVGRLNILRSFEAESGIYHLPHFLTSASALEHLDHLSLTLIVPPRWTAPSTLPNLYIRHLDLTLNSALDSHFTLITDIFFSTRCLDVRLRVLAHPSPLAQSALDEGLALLPSSATLRVHITDSGSTVYSLPPDPHGPTAIFFRTVPERAGAVDSHLWMGPLARLESWLDCDLLEEADDTVVVRKGLDWTDDSEAARQLCEMVEEAGQELQ